ncbi:MAG: hypothetical protein QY328_15190 [Anaerolineales bacterium]|nr:MAG: hypothetical protein QY328_15190 [Anaerolineales bacterium]
MKEPLRTRYAPGYDLFKLVVAILLTVLLIVLLLRERDKRFEALSMSPTQAVVADVIVPTATIPAPASTAMPEPTQTEVAPTEMPVTETPVAETAPTETAAAETPPADPQPVSDPNECPSNPTRIQVGMTVRVLDWLNFRVAPGLGKTIQTTNRPGTQMEVIGGPVCTPQGGDPPRAYLWWNLRMADGREGWSAEAPLNFPNYFMEPVE